MDWHSDDLGLRNPAIKKKVEGKRATSIVERAISQSGRLRNSAGCRYSAQYRRPTTAVYLI